MFWECACLSVNAGSSQSNLDEIDSEEAEEGDDVLETEENSKDDSINNTDTTNKSSAPNYEKIAKAICEAQLRGITIEFPDINKAGADFLPDIEHNGILYSLRAVVAVSDDLFNRIIQNRPYKNFSDFYEKVKPTVSEAVGCIKAGCFNSLFPNISRKDQMMAFFRKLANNDYPMKTTLTMTHIKKRMLDKTNIENSAFNWNSLVRLKNFKDYIDKFQYNADTKSYEFNDKDVLNYYNKEVKPVLSHHLDEKSILKIINLTQGVVRFPKTLFTKFFNNKIQPLVTYFNSEEGLKAYNEWEKTQYIEQLKEKYGFNNSIADWEMEQISFYSNHHELSNINEVLYSVKNFFQLDEYMSKDQFCAIAGTVIGNNNTKHIVSLLTPYGVVQVKMFANIYNRYKSKISIIPKEETDKKKPKKQTLDDSWFKRGTKLLIYGYRNENLFVTKTVKLNNYSRCVCLIEDKANNGLLTLRYSRKTTE